MLYARIGIPHCPKCGKVISQQSVDQIVDQVMALGIEPKIQVLAPIIRGKKRVHEKILDNIKEKWICKSKSRWRNIWISWRWNKTWKD